MNCKKQAEVRMSFYCCSSHHDSGMKPHVLIKCLAPRYVSVAIKISTL